MQSGRFLLLARQALPAASALVRRLPPLPPCRVRRRWAEYYGGRLIFYYDDEAGARAGQIRGAVNLKDAVLRVGYSEPGPWASPAPEGEATRRNEARHARFLPRLRGAVLGCGARGASPRGWLFVGFSRHLQRRHPGARRAPLAHVALPRASCRLEPMCEPSRLRCAAPPLTSLSGPPLPLLALDAQQM